MARAMPPTRAGGEVDHVASAIEFVHIALGSSPVLVKQSLEPVADGRDATARCPWLMVVTFPLGAKVLYNVRTWVDA